MQAGLHPSNLAHGFWVIKRERLEDGTVTTKYEDVP